CRWAWHALAHRAGELAVVRTPMGFVDAFAEALVPLLDGVPVGVAREAAAPDTDRLTRLVRDSGATRLLLTPSLLSTILDAHDDAGDRLGGLLVCTLSGEELGADLARRVARVLPRTRLINLYGATEVAGDATWFDATNLPVDAAVVPIGVPIDNTAVQIVDDAL